MVEESNGLREQVAGLDKLVAKLQHKNMELSRGYSSAKTGECALLIVLMVKQTTSTFADLTIFVCDQVGCKLSRR